MEHSELAYRRCVLSRAKGFKAGNRRGSQCQKKNAESRLYIGPYGLPSTCDPPESARCGLTHACITVMKVPRAILN